MTSGHEDTRSTASSSERWPAWKWTAGVAGLLFTVGVWAMPERIQAGDAGEFATVMLSGGVPHPSGYPWMRILGLLARIFAGLGLPPASAAALPCVLAGVAGWSLMHRVSLTLGVDRERGEPPSLARTVAASFAIGLCALGPPVVLHTNDSEVWGPLVLMVGLVTYVAVVARARPAALGFAFGLALSHHLTAALLLPICVASAWPRPFSLPTLLRNGGKGVLGGLVGLAPYATLALGTGDGWRWGDTRTWSGLLHHVSRADYGVLSLSLHTSAPDPLQQWSRVATSMGGTVSAGLVTLPLLAGVLVLLVFVVALRGSPGVSRQDKLGIWLAALGSTWLFPLAHNIDPTNPFGSWILERFDIMSLALLAPLLAVSLYRLAGFVEGRGRAGWGLGAAAALLLVRQLLVTGWHGIPADNPHVERYARDVLQTPRAGDRALVFGTDDHRLFPITFVQEVLGVAPDVLYIDASLLVHPWYRERLRRRFPDLPQADKPVRLMQALWDDPLWRDVPVYLSNDFSRPSRSLPRVPEGLLWRVIPPHEESAAEFSADRVLERHRAALSRYGAPPGGPLVAGHPFAADLMTTYTEGTAGLAQALRAEGRPDAAEALLRYALDPPPPPPD